jgi:hypothetical protein
MGGIPGISVGSADAHAALTFGYDVVVGPRSLAWPSTAMMASCRVVSISRRLESRNVIGSPSGRASRCNWER